MLSKIIKIVTSVIQNPQFIEIAKNVIAVQVLETDTHIAFLLCKNNSQNTGIIHALKQMIPEAMIFTTQDGKPFLNIQIEKTQVERALEEANYGRTGEEGQAYN